MSITQYQKELYEIKEGMVFISNRESRQANGILISDRGILLSDQNLVNGIFINSDGVVIQGKTVMSAYGRGIQKGAFTENPSSAKLYTYPETLYVESAAKEAAYQALATQAGFIVDDNVLGDGRFPLITDIGGVLEPHVHTITMKHVHRVEPAYLYRVPPRLTVWKDFISNFKQFLTL